MRNGAGLSTGMGLFLAVYGFVMHVWTIVIALDISGLFWAFVTTCLPVVAEIYWFFAFWKIQGTALNPYCLVVLGCPLLWMVAFIIQVIHSARESYEPIY